jgi:CTP:molybdopterin cytidylyltransferase MocA
VVVLREADAERARGVWSGRDERVRVVINPRPDAGRTGSLQVGVGAVPRAGGILLHPVDHPLVAAETVRTLLSAWRSAMGQGRGAAAVELVEPTIDGHRGHPILLGRGLEARICELRADAPLYTLVRDLRARGRARAVAVTDSGILANLDRPEDWERWSTAGFPGSE